jgi:hypothetical protein
MPQVQERTARKKTKCDVCPKPIEPGQKYYKWAFYRGPVQRQHSTHGYPKPSQLTQSKMSGVYSAIESAETNISTCDNPADIALELRTAADDIEVIKEEYEEGLSNKPDGLRDADTDTQEKIDALSEFIDELRSTADDIEGESDGTDIPEKESWLSGLQEKAKEVLSNLSL